MEIRGEFVMCYCKLRSRVMGSEEFLRHDAIMNNSHLSCCKWPIKLTFRNFRNSNRLMREHDGKPVKKLQDESLPERAVFIECPPVRGEKYTWHTTEPSDRNSNRLMREHDGKPVKKLQDESLPERAVFIECPPVRGEKYTWHTTEPSRERTHATRL